MTHAPNFGGDPRDTELRDLQTTAGYFYTVALNECLTKYPEQLMLRNLERWKIPLLVSLDCFWVCLSGVKRTIYHGVYGWETNDYLQKIYDPWRLQVENLMEEKGYQGNVFVTLEEDIKQMVTIFSPGPHPRCTPAELARGIDRLGQEVYEEGLFRGDARYCNATALSDKLQGYTGIRKGYLQTRKLNDLFFFRMEPGVLTKERVAQLRNGADYWVVIGECRKLEQALDAGDPALCKKQLERLFLKTVKDSFRWTLLRDALSYCKHMLELRCIAQGMGEVELELLCDSESYLRIEDHVQALWPILEKLCALIGEQRPYQTLILRAIYYIKLHYTEDIALTDVADYANVNPNYLSGTFQKEMGLSLRDFITNERIKAAKRLLEEGALRVSDVAERVGVHDVRYFSRLFKKAVGCTPGEYREQNTK